MYHCLNVVTEPAGRPAALLVRAVEPITGMDLMRQARIDAFARRRRVDPARLEVERGRIARLPDAHLARGPGLVAAAFGLDRTLTGTDLLDPGSAVRLERAERGDRRGDPVWTARIGIDYAGEPWARQPWRLIDAASPSISGPRRPATTR
jgi:DNA-3-methyladenine glycosylase